MTWFTDMVAGNSVSVYADIDGACRKGMNKPFEGQKLFVGNGTVQLSRDDIYRAGGGQRSVRITMILVFDLKCCSQTVAL